jgi:hypothetical protein
MTLLRFPGGFFKKPRERLSGFMLGNCMNYLVLGNLVLLPGLFLIRAEPFWIGLVLIAAVPAAAVVLPLGDQMDSDKTLTLAGVAGTLRRLHLCHLLRACRQQRALCPAGQPRNLHHGGHGLGSRLHHQCCALAFRPAL